MKVKMKMKYQCIDLFEIRRLPPGSGPQLCLRKRERKKERSESATVQFKGVICTDNNTHTHKHTQTHKKTTTHAHTQANT